MIPFNFVIPEITIGGEGTPPLQFYKRGFVINGSTSPTWQDVIISGNTALTLVNAKANGLNYLKLFGDTELLPETYIDSVTAEGKCIQRNLPEGYTQVEYIESSGTQYIDTGITNENCNTYSVKTKYSYTANTTNSLCGNFEYTTGKASFGQIYFQNGTSSVYSGVGNVQKVSISPVTINTNYTDEFSIDASTGTITRKLNGTTYTGTDLDFSTRSEKTCLLFACNSANGATQLGSEKIYYFQIYKDGNLVLNLVPCKNSSNVAGMYDTVSGTFFTNEGTGDFTAGASAPTPNAPIDIVCNNGALKTIAPLPQSYTALEYIEGTGTQYIDTGELFAPNIKIYMETMYLSPMNSYGWGRNANDQEVLWAGTQFFFGNGRSITSARELNKKYAYDLDFTAGDMKAYINGELMRQTDRTYAETQYNEMYLFACNNMGSILPYAGRLYSFRYQNGSTVVLNLIPAKRNSDNVLGMYDTVSGTFFTNAGTGTFTAGAELTSIYTDGTVETITDNVGNVATCQNLLSVGDYKDTQEILSGLVTHNVGIKVLDGTETWTETSSEAPYVISIPDMLGPSSADGNTVWTLNTHFIVVARNPSWSQYSNLCSTNTGNSNVQFRYQDNQSTLADFKQFLADQYAQGTPVIIVYPLATATTESVTGQFLSKAPVTYAGSIAGLTGTVVTSSHTTPTPTQPLQINCNNGVVKYGWKYQRMNAADYSDWTNSTTDGTAQVVDGSMVYTLTQAPTGDFGLRGSPIFPLTANNKLYITFDVYLSRSAIQGQISDSNGRIAHVNAFQDVTWTSANVWQTVKMSADANANGLDFQCQCYPRVQSSGWTTGDYWKIRNYRVYDLTAIFGAGNEPTTLADIETALFGIYTNGTQEKVEIDTTGDYALAEMLLAVGNYEDEQSVLDGEVTRKVGIKVLDGTENWKAHSSLEGWFSLSIADVYPTPISGVCTHYTYNNDQSRVGVWFSTGRENNPTNRIVISDSERFPNTGMASEFKAWLSDQYNAGQPVIVVYPLATATTESVTAQSLTTKAGTNIVEITEASIDNLGLEVNYKATV